MIKYALACEQGHEFESWFPSGDAYDAQAKRGFVSCPICNSTKVEKAVMAPRVARAAAAQPQPAPAPEPQPVAMLSEKEREIRALLRAVREHVVQNAENVGKGFAEEARKMHYGEIDHRSIYGEATPVEARELLEEGIEVHPMPVVPDDRN
ncbi:MAG TPA: DUF1178 family protein [Microvirga sp.]|nr:DUF1178 family protein [Microvirga sp.]